MKNIEIVLWRLQWYKITDVLFEPFSLEIRVLIMTEEELKKKIEELKQITLQPVASSVMKRPKRPSERFAF